MLQHRLVTRSLVVLGALLFVAVLRLDQAVGTAYDASWVPPEVRASPFTCGDCLRLPSNLWVAVYALASIVSLWSFLGAVWLWRRRCLDDEKSSVLHRSTFVVTLLVTLLALVAATTRVLAAGGEGKALLGAGTAAAFVSLALVLAIAAATGHLLHTENVAPGAAAGLGAAFRRMLHRQRMNLLVVLALSAGLLVVGDTSGQSVDSIRTWTPLEFAGGGVDWSSHGAARLALGLAAAFLLALVVYESALKLAYSPASNDTLLPRTRLLLAGGGLLAAGALLWWPLDFGPGVAFLGAALVLVAVLDLPDLTRPDLPPHPPPTALERGAPEWLATVPLLALAATAVTGGVESALSGGRADAFLTALPALVLAGFAVLMTAESPPQLQAPPRGLQVALAAVLVVVAVLLVAVGGTAGAGVTGFLVASGLVWYAWRLRRRPAGAPPWRPYTFALAVGAAVGLAAAIHLEPLGTGQALGTIPLALVALAFAVVLFNFAIAATLTVRPPRLLWWLRFEQLPVLTLALLWWAAVGPFSAEELHDIRVVDRESVAGRPLHPRPQLEAAFLSWVAAQPELREDTAGRPVPLVLVAAHGGGIRAAYFTAVALDCVVGVSAGEFDARALERDDEAELERTCETVRRTEAQQQAAARRIFLASGVSGGAVGLYAYARQLLHNGSLGDGSWVEQRLQDDFAGPTVGWALYHDAPNRLLGYHPGPGGACRLEVRAACWTHDRAAVIEEAFDGAWNVADENALLRHAYDLRFAPAGSEEAARARLLPILLLNTTLTGGRARGAISAVDLGAWPEADAVDRARGDGRLPLAGTVEVVDSLCAAGDVRLSTAALLAARFPYVLPSGRVGRRCARGAPREEDGQSSCATDRPECEGRFVDGGYADNSGLFSIVALWPSLRDLIARYNAARDHERKIAPLIVELDNHYQSAVRARVPYGGVRSQLLAPPLTAFGGRGAIETYARAAAYRILPATCTVTIAPRIHPGLIAPLGWELSESARADLSAGLVRPHPGENPQARNTPMELLRQAQSRLAGEDERRPRPLIGKALGACLRPVGR